MASSPNNCVAKSKKPIPISSDSLYHSSCSYGSCRPRTSYPPPPYLSLTEPLPPQSIAPKSQRLLLHERTTLLLEADTLRHDLKMINGRISRKWGEWMYDNEDGKQLELELSIFRLEYERDKMVMRLRRDKWFQENKEFRAWCPLSSCLMKMNQAR